MPLHLLGKKSWNVYNTDNVERVRRDEAAAKAAEEARDERMQEADSARRLAIMRGETPPPLPEESEEPAAGGALVKRDAWPTGERRKRKRVGEDDTDFEMRVALERRAEGEAVAARLAQAGPSTEDVPGEKSRRDIREVPGPTTFGAMKEVERGWYVKPVRPGDDIETPGTDAFGREDPNRKARDAVRLDKNDPLAMMKRGAAKVREIGKERKREAEERERELRALRKEQRRREKRRRRRDAGTDEVDELEGFSLDAPAVEMERDEDQRKRSRHHSHHGHVRREERDGRESRHGRDAEVRHRSSHRGEDERRRHSHRHQEHEERVRAT